MYLCTKKKTRYPWGNNKTSSEPEETLSSQRNLLLVFLPKNVSDVFHWPLTHTAFVFLFTLCIISKKKKKKSIDFFVIKCSDVIYIQTVPLHISTLGKLAFAWLPFGILWNDLALFHLCVYAAKFIKVHPRRGGSWGGGRCTPEPRGFARLYQLHPTDPRKRLCCNELLDHTATYKQRFTCTHKRVFENPKIHIHLSWFECGASRQLDS